MNNEKNQALENPSAMSTAGLSSAEAMFYQRHYDNEFFHNTEFDFESFLKLRPIAESSFGKNGRYSLVTEVLAANPVDKLLELGCGWGEHCAHMMQYAADVTGVDIVLPKWVQNVSRPNLALIEANANEQLPFAPASFDAIIGMMVVEHLFDPFKVVAELRRLIKPNGVVILNLPLVTSWKNRLNLLFGRLPQTSYAGWFEQREWDGGHLHYFSWPMITKLMATAGFEITHFRAVGRMSGLKTAFLGILAGEVTFAARVIR